MKSKKTTVIRKFVSVFAAFAISMLSVFNFTACNDKGASDEESKSVDTLKIMISPYQDAGELLTSMKPLEELIKQGMAERGYEVKNIEMTVGTSYSAVGEALSAGSVDVGFISGGTYVTYDEDCDVLLTALRESINKDSTNAKDWNDGSEEKFNSELTTYYRSVIVAGPSKKGQELISKVNAGEKLTWDDLNSATWSTMGASSASGYMYPSLWLKNNYGKQIKDLAHVVQSDSYTTLAGRLASGQVDIIVCYGHVRAKFASTWESKLGGTNSIYKQTGIIAVTDKIMDDTISVSKSSEVMTDGFKKAFGETMIAIGETDEGKEALNTISHKGYQWANDSDYDAERQVQQMLKEK